MRELLYLQADESLEPSPPQVHNSSKPYARVVMEDGRVTAGLPGRYSVELYQALVEAASKSISGEDVESVSDLSQPDDVLRDTLTAEDIIIGRVEQLELFRECLRNAKSTLVIHSCFVSAKTLEVLLPDFEEAAKRRVRIEILWGLNLDTESDLKRSPIAECERTLDGLAASLRSRVQFSANSSGSHAKVILYDDKTSGRWTSVVSSCNFLSGSFDWIEGSFRSRNEQLAKIILGYLISTQLPAAGGWSPQARRLNRTWDLIRRSPAIRENCGEHQLKLLVDHDHYGSVRLARDIAESEIVLGCDIFGIAAETSVLVPMTRAAELGKKVQIYFSRASKILREEGREPEISALMARGLNVQVVDKLHIKFIHYDPNVLILTSFNWLATVVTGTRARGAEVGLMVQGPEIRDIFVNKLSEQMTI